MLIFLILLALAFAFLNGYRDSSSILAGVIASRAMHPRLALYLAAAAERVNKVRWQVGIDMLTTWGLTIPATMAIAFIIHWTGFAAVKLNWLVGWLLHWLMQG